MDLAYQLYALTDNATEKVTITSVTTSSSFTDDATSWRIGRTYWKVGGEWRRITARRPVVIKAGSDRTIRVELVNREQPSRFVNVKAAAPKKAAGKMGELLLSGGASSGDEEYYFYEDEDSMMEEMGGGDMTDDPRADQVLQDRPEERRDPLVGALPSGQGDHDHPRHRPGGHRLRVPAGHRGALTPSPTDVRRPHRAGAERSGPVRASGGQRRREARSARPPATPTAPQASTQKSTRPAPASGCVPARDEATHRARHGEAQGQPHGRVPCPGSHQRHRSHTGPLARPSVVGPPAAWWSQPFPPGAPTVLAAGARPPDPDGSSAAAQIDHHPRARGVRGRPGSRRTP